MSTVAEFPASCGELEPERNNGLLETIDDEDVSTLAALPASRGELEPETMLSLQNGVVVVIEDEAPSATP